MTEGDSAHVVVVQGGRVLLLRRGPDAPRAPGRWCVPGGRIEPGETPAQAAVRELAAGAGIDPPYQLAFAGLAGGNRYVFRAERPTLYPFDARCRDEEHDAACWVDAPGFASLRLAPWTLPVLTTYVLAAGRVGA